MKRCITHFGTELLRGNKMEVKNFDDTDTLFIQFNQKQISGTRELNENTYVDFDHVGIVVSITVEHAMKSTNLNDFSFRKITKLVS